MEALGSHNRAMRWRARFPCTGLGVAPVRGALGVALVVAGLGLGCGSAEPQPTPQPGGVGPSPRVACDLYAATEGSDSAPGSRSRPLRTAEGLARALDRGQTGCFRGGTYAFAVLQLTTPGVTLAPYRDEAVTLEGEIKVLPGGADSTIEGLKLDGAGGKSAIGPRIYADGVVLRDNGITNEHTGICVHVDPVLQRPAAPGSDHRAQSDPRLRRAAGDQPPARHLRRPCRRHGDPRQLDLRQRRPGRPALPRRAAARGSSAT